MRGELNRRGMRGWTRIPGCWNWPPAAFSHRSEAQRTRGVRLASSLAAALRNDQFEHPGGPRARWWIPIELWSRLARNRLMNCLLCCTAGRSRRI